MALYSFSPVAGPNANQASSYYLPYSRDQAVTTLSAPEDQVIRLAQSSGSWLATGTGAPWVASATIQCTLFFGGNWLSKVGAIGIGAPGNPYTPDIDGLESALVDFSQWVLQGGLGILTDRWKKTGSGFHTRTTTAVAIGDIATTRVAGLPYISIDCSFVSPSGFWTDGGQVYPIV